MVAKEIEITVNDIIDAIEKNGITPSRGSYFRYDEGQKIIAACALGQAAYNLKVTPTSLHASLSEINDLGDKIVTYNDGMAVDKNGDYRYHTYKEIVAYVRRFRKAHGHKTIKVYTADYSNEVS